MNETFLREKIVLYIGISKKTEHEVINKLKKLNATTTEISSIVLYLKDLGYINDVDYTKSFIKQNLKFEKYSVYEIYQKLLQKGIDISIIESEIEELSKSDYESQVVRKLIDNKLKNYDPLKRKSYLYRKGFKLDNYLQELKE